MASETASGGRALAPADLLTLEQYARERNGFRARVLAHKRARTVAVGPHVTWVFEDRLTIQYQVQEMLRIERIFEPEGIQEELDAYNPLIPDGGNWKATMMIEYPDAAERAAALARLRGIEDLCYVQVDGQPRAMAIADEDFERENDEKTSAVHWLRFELPAAARGVIGLGAAVAVGVDHPRYRHSSRLAPETVASLAADFE
jgi:Protein of unknown function (DUF3501)